MPNKAEWMARFVKCPTCRSEVGFQCADLRSFLFSVKHPHRERIEAGKKFVAEKEKANAEKYR